VCTVASGLAAAVSVSLMARLKLTAPSLSAGQLTLAYRGHCQQENFPAMSVRHTLKMYHYLA
jgi:hypothetical protein